MNNHPYRTQSQIDAELTARRSIGPTEPATSDWRHRRECATEDPDLFHPTGNERRKQALAKEVCARCPVSAQCLGWALSTREPHSICGGTTWTERQAILRRSA